MGLSTGTYYIQVTQRSGNTLYNLSLSSNALFANINDSIKFFTGDFNGDNLQDAIRQKQGSLINGIGDAQFYLGTTNGGYTAGVDISNMNAVAGNVANLIVGDFNGDGRDDLIRQEFGSYVNGVSDTQILTFQNGNFQLVGNIANMLAFNGNFTNLITGDFNQDGRMDLLRQEKGAWANGQNDVEIYLSTGGWNFGASPVINNASSMTGDNTRLVTSGADIMRLEFGSIVNGVSDVNFTTFANGNLQTLQNNAPANFTNAVVAKPWEASIGSTAIANAAILGTIVSNQATLISPLGTTGRYSTYSSGSTIYWSAKTGSVLVTAAMENIYKPQGGSGGWLGFVIGKEYASQGGIRQDFEGGYLFKDANQSVALRPNQSPNFAPTGLIINGLQSSYGTNSVLQLTTSYAGDSNGWNDVAKVDFWLTNSQGQRVELADATSFTVNNNVWASFQYGTNLSGISAGNYTFRAIAYDKASLAGASFSQALSIVSPNVAPKDLQIYGVKQSYDANSTLAFTDGYAFDSNGWQDVAKVDFWLTNAQGQRIELSDVSSFSSYDTNFAKFGYSTSLTGLSAGNYKLCGIAYDKAGVGSNSIAQAFTIVTPNVAPTGLLIYGLQSSYNTNSTLQLSTSYAGDSNGWNDIAKVDFWLTNLQNQRVELADATSFTVNNDFWASFQYGTNLSGIAAGNYTFRAIAYDKAGLVGTAFSQALSIVSPNVAPTSLQIQGLQTSYETNATLTLSAGFVWDANGWADAAKVDFWLTNSLGQRIELSDVTTFSSHDANYARFGYSTGLNGLSAGNYKLCAIAYDKSGAGSNVIENALVITAISNDPGNTLASAESQNSAIFTRSDRVDALDKNDFYRFNITQSGIFTANLTGLTGDADVRLIQDQNNNGLIDQGEVIAWQWERGNGSETLRRFLGSGTYFLEVMSYNQQSSNYTVGTGFTASATDDQRFSIGIDFTTGSEYFTQTMKEAIVQAGKFWENIITHGSLNGAHNLRITVGGTFQTWMNGGGALASAGPRNFTPIGNGRFLPTQGISNVNIAPGAMSYMSQNFEYFKGVMIHEFGHVLGIGTMWEGNGSSLIDRNTATYRANTYAGWAHGELLGTFAPTAIRLTTGEGEGSDYSHWNESVFQNELMTSQANWNGMPTSQMTIAALRDLGWNVNYGAAQAYALSAGRAIGIVNISGTALPNSASLQHNSVQSQCGCSKHLAGNGFNTTGSSNLSQLIGIA